MHPRRVKDLLDRLRRGAISTEAALRSLKHLPYEDLGFAKVDNHRHLRRGFPEVVYGEGKTVPQILAIVGRMVRRRQPVLVTRVGKEVFRKVRLKHRRARFHATARVITLNVDQQGPRRPGILVLAAGTSDLPVAEEAAVTAEVSRAPAGRAGCFRVPTRSANAPGRAAPNTSRSLHRGRRSGPRAPRRPSARGTA